MNKLELKDLSIALAVLVGAILVSWGIFKLSQIDYCGFWHNAGFDMPVHCLPIK